MTVYALIQLLTTACAASAELEKDVTVWWSEDKSRVYISKRRPTMDAVDLKALPREGART